METWKGIRETFIFQEMETFAEKAISLGKEHAVTALEQWGHCLRNQAEHFDMENLPETIDVFPRILENISLILDEQEGTNDGNTG